MRHVSEEAGRDDNLEAELMTNEELRAEQDRTARVGHVPRVREHVERRRLVICHACDHREDVCLCDERDEKGEIDGERSA